MSENSLNDTSNYQLEFPVNGKEMIDAALYRRNVKKIDRLVKMEAEDRAEADTALGDKISVIAGHIGEPYDDDKNISTRLVELELVVNNAMKTIENSFNELFVISQNHQAALNYLEDSIDNLEIRIEALE